MKKFLVFVLSLVCGAAIASCAGGNGGETKNAETVSLTDKEITVYVGETYQFTPSGADSYERRAAYRGGGQRRYADSGRYSRRKAFGRESEIFL